MTVISAMIAQGFTLFCKFNLQRIVKQIYIIQVEIDSIAADFSLIIVIYNLYIRNDKRLMHTIISAYICSIISLNLNPPYSDKKKQLRYDSAYLRMAFEWAKLSHCTRKKVGALIVKGRMIISDGYNGTPSGFENECEDEEGNTKWYVLHAEANAIMKVAASTNDSKGATLYMTLSPCRECSKLIHQAGIKRIVFANQYKDTKGIDFLEKAGVEVVHIAENEILEQ